MRLYVTSILLVNPKTRHALGPSLYDHAHDRRCGGGSGDRFVVGGIGGIDVLTEQRTGTLKVRSLATAGDAWKRVFP